MENDYEQFIYKPLVWLLRISGVSLFKRNIANLLPVAIQEKINVSSITTVFTVTLTGSASAYCTWHFVEYVRLTSPEIQRILYIVCAIVGPLAPVAFMIISYLKHDCYILIWSELFKLISQLDCGKHMKKYKALFFYFVVQLSVFTIARVLEYGLSAITAALLVVYTVSMSALLQEVVLISLAELGFAAINRQLEDLSVSSVESVDIPRSRMADLLLMHTKLHDVVIKINSHFGFYNLTILFTRLAFTVVIMYAIFDSITSQQENSSNQLALSIVKLSLFLLHIMCLVMFSHACSKEASRTVRIAHSMVHYDGSTPSQVVELVEQFSLATLNSEVRVSVAGVANLDRSFITKCAAASMTYLLITLQISNA